MAVDNLSKRELYERIGYMNQIAEFKWYVLCEGRKDGAHAVDIWDENGLGLTTVHNRVSDISSLWFQGKSLCRLSSLGVSRSEFTGQEDFEWNQNFSGGVFVTYGLTAAGLSLEDGGERLEFHGGVSSLPSGKAGCKIWWDHDGYVAEFESRIRQARPPGEHLCLIRNIRVKVGDNMAYVHGQVENLGLQDASFMTICRIDLGYPLLDEGSRTCLTRRERYLILKLAKVSVGKIGVTGEPDDGYVVRVHNRRVETDGDGFVYVSLLSKRLGMRATVKLRAGKLNQLNLWECLQEGRYVVGLKPCSCWIWRRDKEGEAGNLEFIRPFERWDLHFEIQMYDDADEVRQALEGYEERYRLRDGENVSVCG